MKRTISSLLVASLLAVIIPVLPVLGAESQDKEDGFTMYDVPLDEGIQHFIQEKCTETDIPMELVLALIETESGYREDVVSKTNDYGLMQINRCNHSWLKRDLGLEDMLDPRQNITAGMYMLKQHLDKYGDTHKALMVYNMGSASASRLWKQGIYSSKYSRKVVAAAETIKEMH